LNSVLISHSFQLWSFSETLVDQLPGFYFRAFLPLRVEIHLAQTELRFGNGKWIQMKKIIAEGEYRFNLS